MTSLLTFLYITLGVLIASVEIRRVQRGQPFNSLTLFNGAYFLFYVFVPLNVLAFGGDAVRQKYAYQTWSHGDHWTALVLIATYAVFVMGYSRESVEQRKQFFAARYDIRIAIWLIVAFTMLGTVSLAYHISLVGGVVEALQFAPAVRTGEFQLAGNVLFVRQFAAFSATAFMLAYAIYIDLYASDMRSPKQTSYAWCGLLLVPLGIVFIYYALSTYGRREFLYPIIICLIVWSLAGNRRAWWGFSWLLGLSIFWFLFYSFIIPALFHSQFVISQDAATTQAATTQAATTQAATTQAATTQAATTQAATTQALVAFVKEAYFRTIQGLADSFVHFIAAQHAKLWQFGFLSDWWEIPTQFLPSQVLGFERPRGMFGETSEFILGRPLEPGRSGEEPLGLHGYLLVNFSYAGMLVVFYFMGVGYRKLDRALRPGRAEQPWDGLSSFGLTSVASNFSARAC